MHICLFDEIKELEIIPGFWGKFVHSESNTFALWRIEKDCIMPEHSHFHEQSAMLLEGEFRLTVSGEEVILKPGKMVVIPGNVPHSGKALTRCAILDIFHPVREEYKKE